jgi:hypothetical protein
MRSRLPLLLLLLAVAPESARARPLPQAPPAHPEDALVERILAVVDGRPLLLSEVRALQAVRGLPPEQALEAAIDERLMYTEASRLPQAEVGPEEEDRALEDLEARLAARGVSTDDEAELRRLVRRQSVILKYVDFRFRPQIRVSDEDVRKEWEDEQAGRPRGPALEDEETAIRARLEKRALDERIEGWVKELRARADVRYVPDEPVPAS